MDSSTRTSTGGWTPRLARNLRVSWWYTFATVLLFELALIFVWVSVLSAEAFAGAQLVLVLLGGVAWVVATAFLLLDYRYRDEFGPVAQLPRQLAPIIIAVCLGAFAGILAHSWMLAFAPAVQTLLLLNWPRGLRLRLTLAATALLIALAIIGPSFPLIPRGEFNPPDWMLGFYSALLPMMTVLSLWWWDMLLAFDRARVAETRLAAAQERLRVATDVHDLQGHHLQVIALQLELAERLLPEDQASGMLQLRAARASVDEARQGTRDLAARFREVPLRDEIENAADLLRAGGATVETELAHDLDGAPGQTLGPVIRETTTNVLRHGGGTWARLALTRTVSGWQYEIRNDVASFAASEVSAQVSLGAVDSAGQLAPGSFGVEDHDAGQAGDAARPFSAGSFTAGAGLDGLRRRVLEAGGAFHVSEADGEFVVSVQVPADEGSGADTSHVQIGEAAWGERR